jgi:hypothetical protein
MRNIASTKPSKSMPMGFRIRNIAGTDRSYHISKGMKTSGVVSTVGAIGVFAQEHGPGCYTVDQRYPDPIHGTGVISRPWGKAIHHPGGRVTIHIEPIAVSG